MKKIFLIVLITFGYYCAHAQRNELFTFYGIEIVDDENFRKASIMQFKYEYLLNSKFSLQVGIRNQNILIHKDNETYLYLQSAYYANKFDLTFLFVPIRHEKYNIKIGAGIDVGKVNYYFASTGRGFDYYTDDNKYSHSEVFWNFRMAEGYEPGIHFVLQGNYYFRNKMFFASQVLLNQVSPKTAQKGYLVAEDVLSINVGIGYRF